MTVLVSGATSQIGRFLLPRLVAAQRPVLALSRHAQPAQPGVEWWAADMRALPAPPHPWQAIVSFAPLDAWGDWLARQEVAPAAKIIVTSSMSVLTKQDSAQPDEQALVALLQRGEQNLAAQATRLGMQWTVLRPTLVYGAGVDRSLTPIVQRARRTHVFPIPMAHGLRQPVHADDIALAVMAALSGDAADGQVLQIGGGERLDYQQMFRRVHASIGTPCLPLYLPSMALRLLAAALPRARGPVSRLSQDLIADNSALTALLGVQPRAFAPTPATWHPMSQ
jgi:nucleoside-diphosphate-sugar epimerase